MADIVKALLAAPVNAVLLVAGLAFLGVAVFRRITDRLDAGPKGRLFAGLLGIVLIVVSLYLSATTGPTRDITFGDAAMQPDAPATQSNTAYPVELPAGQEVKGEDRSYIILKIALDRHEIDQLALTFTIRMTNQSQYPANFWNASFACWPTTSRLHRSVSSMRWSTAIPPWKAPSSSRFRPRLKRLGCRSTSWVRTRRRCRLRCPRRRSGTPGRVSAFSPRNGRIGR